MVKWMQEGQNALMEKLNMEELILRDGEYGQQWTNGPGREGATEKSQQEKRGQKWRRLKWCL